MEEVCKRPRSDGTGTSEREAQQIVGDKLGTGSAQPRAQSSLPSTVYIHLLIHVFQKGLSLCLCSRLALSPHRAPRPHRQKGTGKHMQ